MKDCCTDSLTRGKGGNPRITYMIGPMRVFIAVFVFVLVLPTAFFTSAGGAFNFIELYGAGTPAVSGFRHRVLTVMCGAGAPAVSGFTNNDNGVNAGNAG